jgi:hypothetical protein
MMEGMMRRYLLWIAVLMTLCGSAFADNVIINSNRIKWDNVTTTIGAPAVWYAPWGMYRPYGPNYYYLNPTITVNPTDNASGSMYYGMNFTLATAPNSTKDIYAMTGLNLSVTSGYPTDNGALRSAGDLQGIYSGVTNYSTTANMKNLWFRTFNVGPIAGFSYGVQGDIDNWSLTNHRGTIGTSRPARFRVGNYSQTGASGTAYITGSDVVYANTDVSGTGPGAVIDTAHGFHYDLNVGAGGTITNSYGLRLTTPSVAGTLTNHYGIYLDSQVVAGATQNYAVKVAGGKVGVVGMPVYANNTDALTGGLIAGDFYRTSTGVLMVTY